MGYQNPVISIKGVDHGDPAVLKYNGMYYLYHTGPREIPVYQSTNLVDWEKVGVALHASDDPNHWAQIDLWAPEIIHENGTFYMYVTGAMRNEDGSANDEIRHIGVATSESPTGPFELAQEPLTGEWSIDAHPFKDEDGTYYMFYNVRNDYTKGPNGVIGTGNVVDRLVDLTTLSGNPTMVVKPEHLWEGNKEHSFFWNEGPFVLKRKGTYYQMYSAGFFGDDTYGVYYATSSTPMGPRGMDDTSWKKWKGGEPILKTNEACYGPGHHVVVKGPNGVEDFIVYHGYEPDENVQERRVRVGRFKWEGDHMWLEPPSFSELPLPEAPTFDGRFLQSITDINKGLTDYQSSNFHFETNIAFHTKEKLQTDIFAFVIDEDHRVEWSIGVTNNTIKTKVIKNEIETTEYEAKLASNYNASAYHFFKLTKQGSSLQLYVDHVLVIDVLVEDRKAKGEVRILVNEETGSCKGTILTKA
ncbi:glycoside hydrolase family 43 protein [Halalkalibacter kiskunsagensis]|uniref:Glycoside hydrolase family 43 protein n=1 Tax=Halalkalibacter kiskunsagensis TaxID=1548599 RepID=A0ABV6KEP6_9BACI